MGLHRRFHSRQVQAEQRSLACPGLTGSADGRRTDYRPGPDVHHAVGHRRRRIDSTPRRVLPQERSRAGVQGVHVIVIETRRTPRRWPPPAKNGHSPRRVLPQERSRTGVQGVHVIVIGPDVHHAVGHRRRRVDIDPRSCTSTGALPCWRSRRTRYRHQTRRTPRRWPPPAKNRHRPPSCTSTGALPCWRSGRTRYCRQIRRTPRRWPPPAKNRHRSPVVYFHRSAPVLAFRAYTLLSSDPTYTTPLATAGEEST